MAGGGIVRRLGLAMSVWLGVSMAGFGAVADEARPIDCGAGRRTWLVPFQDSAFPYDGTIPDTGQPFLDRSEGGRRGHTSPRGGVYWENPTYSDRRVLLSVPPQFDPGRPSTIVLFLHGNLATLERDVCRRQGISRQLAASGLNAVLVAPQLAVNALDSSAGRFWESGFAARFLAEAASWVEELAGIGDLRGAPVILVAYSGGYLPAVYAAESGGLGGRLRGIVLLDALFGEVERYADVVSGQRPIFVSAYSASSREPNLRLRKLLAELGLAASEGLPGSLSPGTVTFISATGASHNDFLARAFAPDPLAALLRRLRPGAGR